jgi:hypothetical protein
VNLITISGAELNYIVKPKARGPDFVILEEKSVGNFLIIWSPFQLRRSGELKDLKGPWIQF